MAIIDFKNPQYLQVNAVPPLISSVSLTMPTNVLKELQKVATSYHRESAKNPEAVLHLQVTARQPCH